MIHDAAMVGLLALTHVCCLAVMTERKYSPGKTVAAYAAFAAYCIGWTLIVSAWIGAESPYAAPAMFSATIVAGFFVFVLTSSDALCKKLFLFISYSNLFCILHCTAVLIADALVPSLSDIEMQYARNITRTLLYIPAVLTYLTFFRPRIRTVPVKRGGPGIPFLWFPCCSWRLLPLLWCFSIRMAAIKMKTYFCLPLLC